MSKKIATTLSFLLLGSSFVGTVNVSQAEVSSMIFSCQLKEHLYFTQELSDIHNYDERQAKEKCNQIKERLRKQEQLRREQEQWRPVHEEFNAKSSEKKNRFCDKLSEGQKEKFNRTTPSGSIACTKKYI